ncbi:MAG: hypothetical protein E6K63_10590 [Nitrospirae bacterium]|nr:MAG: hypothetical protein E6K63_10590 [Nitrospirota bacterium]
MQSLSQAFLRPSGMLLACLLLLPAAAMITAESQKSDRSSAVTLQMQAPYGKLPLYFVENQGQVDARVAYFLQGRDTTVYFTSQDVTIALTGPAAAAEASGSRAFARPVGLRPVAEPNGARERWAVKLDFLGANSGIRPIAQNPTPAVISYFKGPREQWKVGLRTYGSLVYRELWPGIDLVFTGTATRLKYSFLLQPGADPARIKLAYRGATVTLTGTGELEVSTPVGSFRDERPLAYQELEGQRVEVAAAYVLSSEAPTGAQGYSFRLGPYDRDQPLVLDPAMLVYAGYLGGTGTDIGHGISVDSAGNAYVTGDTTSSEASFPVTGGPDLTFNGVTDAFVAKVNEAGTALVYAGYIGGTGIDVGNRIAVDSAGHAYVTGGTSSSEASFPVTGGPDLTFNGVIDAFVAKVNEAGTALDYAGYIGGTGIDVGNGIAVDSAGHAYVTGGTSSSEASFPVAVGPDLTFNGIQDAFVTKVNAGGTALDYAGYLGGTGLDGGFGIDVDSTGHAYVSGSTQSSEASFPVMVGPDLTFNGIQDAFVAKVKADGTGLVYAGYLGGTDIDQSLGIAVDSTGNAYVTGRTTSSEASFPVAVGPDLTFNGIQDAFVTKVNAGGTALVYAGYLGGTGVESGLGIAVDSAGHAYVTGFTQSSEASFPATGGPDLTYNGGDFDAFVAKVKADGSGLDYAGYIGGTGTDVGSGIAVDSAGNAYVTGYTESSEATFPVTGGPDLTFNGLPDAFVAKISEVGVPTMLTLEPTTSTNPVKTEHCVTATVKDASGNPTPNVTVIFTVTGAVNTSGSATTDGNGEASFCYAGPDKRGTDAITAYADTDHDSVQEADEPSSTASKTWIKKKNKKDKKKDKKDKDKDDDD